MDWPSYISVINAGPAEKTVHQLAYLGWAPGVPRRLACR